MTNKRHKKMRQSSTDLDPGEFHRNFFARPNLRSSYWAGFIAARACLLPHIEGLSIAVPIEDRDHLENFCRQIRLPQVEWEEESQVADVTLATVRIQDVPEWLRHLKRHYNLALGQSSNLRPPKNLSQENSLAYIKGILDGDGTVDVAKVGHKTAFQVHFLGSNLLLDWIKSWLDRLYPAGNPPQVHQKKHTPIYTYGLTGKRAERLLRDLWNTKTPHLPRKWRKFSLYLEDDGQLFLF